MNEIQKLYSTVFQNEKLVLEEVISSKNNGNQEAMIMKKMEEITKQDMM